MHDGFLPFCSFLLCLGPLSSGSLESEKKKSTPRMISAAAAAYMLLPLEKYFLLQKLPTISHTHRQHLIWRRRGPQSTEQEEKQLSTCIGT